MDEAASRLAMERESVQQKSIKYSARLRQLELAQRQLTEEGDDATTHQLDEIEREMKELQHELASLREQWEAEKLGLSDVKSVRQSLDQTELEFRKLEASIKEKQIDGTGCLRSRLPEAI